MSVRDFVTKGRSSLSRRFLETHFGGIHFRHTLEEHTASENPPGALIIRSCGHIKKRAQGKAEDSPEESRKKKKTKRRIKWKKKVDDGQPSTHFLLFFFNAGYVWPRKKNRPKPFFGWRLNPIVERTANCLTGGQLLPSPPANNHCPRRIFITWCLPLRSCVCYYLTDAFLRLFMTSARTARACGRTMTAIPRSSAG